jgi:hypothetical protein
VSRWIERTVGWKNDTVTRFKNILKAVLIGHDEVLKAFCGSCANQTGVATCECLLSEYQSLGLPLNVQISTPVENCLFIYERIILSECAVDCLAGCLGCLKVVDPSVISSMEVLCGHLCPSVCSVVAFDPCNNPDQLDLLMRIIPAAREGFNKPATGANILAVAAVLFPGFAPSIVSNGNGIIYINIGRDLTILEMTYLDLLTSIIPRGFGVQILFARP